ncbi:MAG TPA: hypothetical protein VGE58_01425 [Daejeonella sp.]
MINYRITCILIALLLLVCTACETREPAFTCLPGKYSKEELIFFSRVGFRKHKTLAKWNSNITVSMGKGDITRRDILTVDSIILELAPLIKPLEISRVPEEGDIIVNFTAEKEDRIGISAFTETDQSPLTKYLTSAKIYVRPTIKGRRRQAVLRHEFLHAMGLAHPVGSFEPMGSRLESRVVTLDNLYPEYGEEDYLYTDMDKAAVRMLYEECLSPGWHKSIYVAFLKGRNIEDKERARRALNDH